MASSTSLESTAPRELNDAHSLFKKVRTFLVFRRVPITLAVFIVLIAEDLIEQVQPHNLLDFTDGWTVVGLTLVFGGLALRSLAAGTLHKSTELTMSGLYGLIRHPLYVGSFLMMVGFCSLIGDSENIWFVLGPILALYGYRVITEERFLAAKFGDKWTSYTNEVPRFIPRRLSNGAFATWNLNQWLKNGEYRAVSAVFVGLIAMQAWYLA